MAQPPRCERRRDMNATVEAIQSAVHPRALRIGRLTPQPLDEERLDRTRLKVRKNTAEFRVAFDASVERGDHVGDHARAPDAMDQVPSRSKRRRIRREAAAVLVRQRHGKTVYIDAVRYDRPIVNSRPLHQRPMRAAEPGRG